MIYVGNGIYSDATPNEYLMHYGVIGMKWGVHRAREHEKNIYRHNRANGMSRQAAKQAYRDRMSGVKQFARENRGTGLHSRDISNRSREEARNTIDNYDRKLKAQRRRKAIAVGLGAAAAGTAAYGGYRLAKSLKAAKKADHLYKRSDLAEDLALATLKAGNKKFKKGAIDRKGYTKYLTNAKRYSDASSGLYDKYKSARNAAHYHGFEATRHGAYAGLIGGAAAGVALANRIKTKRQMRKKKKDYVDHSDMTDPNHLEHYGVLGMKWGVHKAKNHLKLLRQGRSLSKEYGPYRNYDAKNAIKAQELYEKELNEIKNFAKSNKKTKTKVKDIEKLAKDKARSEFGENYDKLYKKMQRSQRISNGLFGLAAGGAIATGIAQKKANRKWEKEHGLKTKNGPFSGYLLNNKGNKLPKGLGAASMATLAGSYIGEAAKEYNNHKLLKEYWKKNNN